MENQNDIHRELTSLPVGKLLWKYSVPAIVGTMVMSLYNVIDRIFIGQGVGADAISGLALTFPIMSLAGAIGMLVGLGASARISIVLGQNDKVKAEKIFGKQSCTFALVCRLLPHLLLGLHGQYTAQFRRQRPYHSICQRVSHLHHAGYALHQSLL